MSFFELLVLSVSLGLDTFGVSLAAGALHRKMSFSSLFTIAFTFGVFHVVMSLLGYFSGSLLRSLVEPIDHWMAFLLLGFVGGKMIYEAVKPGDATEELSHKKNILQFKILLLLAFATSIDALVTGITLPFVHISLFPPVFAISMGAFTLSLLGGFLGKRFGELWGDKVEIVGGVALVLLAFKILLTHIL